MATKDDIAIAIAVIKEVSGNPELGAIKDLLDLLEASSKPATTPKEARVVEAKETR